MLELSTFMENHPETSGPTILKKPTVSGTNITTVCSIRVIPRCQTFVYIALVTVPLASTILHAAPLPRFHAEGQITMISTEQTSPKVSTTVSQGFNFSVSVDGDRWLIRTQPHLFLTKSADCPTEYYEAGTDGTNLYFLDMFNKAYDVRRGQRVSLEKLREEEALLAKTAANSESLAKVRELISSISKDLSNPTREALNEAAGTILLGTVPEYRVDNLISPVWLAFCSTPWLQGSQTNLVPAIFENAMRGGTTYSNILMRAAYTCMSSPPFLPVELDFENDGFLYAVSRTNTNSRGLRKISKGQRGPTVPADYRVTAFKEFDGLQFPEKFTYSRYVLRNQGGKSTTVRRYSIEGTVFRATTNVEVNNFTPKVRVVASITDERLLEAENTAVPYVIKDGHWPGQDVVRSTEDYQRAIITAKKAAQVSKRPWPARQVLAWALLISALLLPLTLRRFIQKTQ